MRYGCLGTQLRILIMYIQSYGEYIYMKVNTFCMTKANSLGVSHAPSIKRTNCAERVVVLSNAT